MTENSFNDAPLEFKYNTLIKVLDRTRKENQELKEQLQEIKKYMDKMKTFYRVQNEQILLKFNTPLSQKQSVKYLKQFIQERKQWGQYCSWLLNKNELKQ